MSTLFEFATPIYSSFVSSENVEAIQNEFMYAFNTYKKVDRFVNPNGFQDTHLISSYSFNDKLFDDFNCNTFVKELHSHIKKYLLECNSLLDKEQLNNYVIDSSWMAWNEPDSYTAVHDHSDSDISGCYYVTANGDEGDLYFLNPNRLFTTSFCFKSTKDIISFRPEAGKLILFPSWLLHGVRRNITSNDRLSVSFNIKFKK